jgi:hypothetical protein
MQSSLLSIVWDGCLLWRALGRLKGSLILREQEVFTKFNSHVKTGPVTMGKGWIASINHVLFFVHFPNREPELLIPSFFVLLFFP